MVSHLVNLVIIFPNPVGYSFCGSQTLCRVTKIGILNLTSDSFYEGSRTCSVQFVERAKKMLADGAAILDVGACSTRPGGEPVPQDVELARLHDALSL